ncbi:hypothetical protein QTG54_007700 [Skeletonema marinoi]|uniref:Uncharacterized protein n=1 Tax=Skeletonema marinoi TaxID=267567 RepID=A0AAD8Y9Q5_9STRA|nr:hypothetical protein QTG54_007700 [Skeletonema marinoi]
MNYHLVAS